MVPPWDTYRVHQMSSGVQSRRPHPRHRFTSLNPLQYAHASASMAAGMLANIADALNEAALDFLAQNRA